MGIELLKDTSEGNMKTCVLNKEYECDNQTLTSH